MIIRTVLGDIDPQHAGPTYAHEHLIIDSPLVADRWPHISLPSVDEAVAELGLCAQAGVRTVVDTMPLGGGGSPAKLALVSKATGVNIVASTGMHTLKYYEGIDWVNEREEALVARFTADLGQLQTSGSTTAPALQTLSRMRQTPTPACGVIKLATSGLQSTDHERRLFAAGSETHRLTGAPIITHCEEGRGGLEQIEMLHTVDPSHVTLSHTDKVDDTGYHRELLGTGVNLVYDQALRQLNSQPATTHLIAAAWEQGFGGQILLGTDGARRTLWSTLGFSPGLAWLKHGYPTVLESQGVGPAEAEMMLVANPARALAFAG